MSLDHAQQMSIEGVDSVHGGMAIRRAREAQGISLEELSSKLKVSVRKMELIERGEFEKVTGGDAYLKGLIRAMCKAVGIDPEPVLHYVPESDEANPLSQLNTIMAVPFAASGRMGKLGTGAPTRRSHGASSASSASSVLPRLNNAWIVGALIAGLGALALYAWPVIQPHADRAWTAVSSQFAKIGSLGGSGNSGAASSKPAATTPNEQSNTVLNNVTTSTTGTAMSAVTQATAEQAAAPASSATAAVASVAVKPDTTQPSVANLTALSEENLTIEATEPTWVEVRNAKGLLLTQRNLAAGERMEQDLNHRRYVVLGNVSGAKVWLRGKPFDASSFARDRVARFEVQ